MSVTDDSTAVPPNGEGNGRNASSPEESARSGSDSSEQQQQVVEPSSTGVDAETSIDQTTKILDLPIKIPTTTTKYQTTTNKKKIETKTNKVFASLFLAYGKLKTTTKRFVTLPE